MDQSRPAAGDGAMTADAIRALAAELMEALQAGDEDKLRKVYAEDAAIWHTFDCKDQNIDTNVKMMKFMRTHLKGARFEDIDVIPVEDGFVQRHVLRGDDPVLEVPTMVRAWCRDGRITRLEEYNDRTQYQPWTDVAERVRAERSRA